MRLRQRFTSMLRRHLASHGYGVHSPFAYRFILNVLRERLPYYGYSELESMRGDMPADCARLLFRVVNYFEPSSISFSGPWAAESEAIARHAYSHFSTVPTEAGGACMVVGTSLHDTDSAPECTGAAVTLMLECSAQVLERTHESYARGICFSNGRSHVTVNRRGLPRLDYRLRF